MTPLGKPGFGGSALQPWTCLYGVDQTQACVCARVLLLFTRRSAFAHRRRSLPAGFAKELGQADV
jgi:hypothetical protein